jgi:hypothetical protein
MKKFAMILGVLIGAPLVIMFLAGTYMSLTETPQQRAADDAQWKKQEQADAIAEKKKEQADAQQAANTPASDPSNEPGNVWNDPFKVTVAQEPSGVFSSSTGQVFYTKVVTIVSVSDAPIRLKSVNINGRSSSDCSVSFDKTMKTGDAVTVSGTSCGEYVKITAYTDRGFYAYTFDN